MLLYDFTGNLDLMISVASYRKSVPGFCVPEIYASGNITGEQIYHPLLDKPVRNDFSLVNRAMITGANASGKSTFMKTFTVNVILAQMIHTCTAESFKLPLITVMTSMAICDDVVSGESYYICEVRYLKRMLDVIEQGIPLFMCD